MRSMACGLLIFFNVMVGCYPHATASPPTGEQSKVPIDFVLSEIQRALIRVQNSTEKEHLPPLNSVELVLSTQFMKGGNGKLNLYIVSLGGLISKDTTQTLVLKLAPPERGTPLEVSGDSLSQQLSDAILLAAKSAYQATKREPPLLLDELSVRLKFVIIKEGSGGIDFRIMPVSIEMGGKLNSVDTQEMAITFQKKK